ncbi:MAG: nucleotidyltransferase family protein [Elusimicrobia bacterium]|nr:nucleotidyltransferase family protein [Elusimicrobiota bacterium]
MSERGPAKAFLLAAGLGTRLRPLTDKTPKCLVPVGGMPLLHWWLLICERLGVREVLLNTHHLAEQVREFVGSRHNECAVKTSHEPELLGSAGTLSANKAFVAGEQDFWIFYADTLIGADLSPLYRLHRSKRADLTLGLFKSPDPKSGGVVELAADGRVLSFEEKPAHPKSDLVAAGAYVGGPALLAALPPGRGDLSRDVYPKLMGNACGAALDPVIDLGTPESYARAQKEWSRFGLA